MKQLCYLAPADEEHKFDSLFVELDIVSSYYATGQISSLTGFIMREKTINQQDYVVCDLTGTSWSQEHILSAVQQLRRFSVAQLIFIAPTEDKTALLFGRLAAHRVDDLIAVGQDTNLQEELRRCLTRKDEERIHQRLYAMQNAMATSAGQVAAPLKIPTGMLLTVMVGGTMPRIGTTTQAFGIFHYLKRLGFSPCMLDPERKLIDVFLSLYGDQAKEEDRYITINDLTFSAIQTDSFNAYVQDIGVITESVRGKFCAADIRVLVGGTKPWELPALAAAVSILKDEPGEMVTLISFAAEGDMENVGKYLGRHSTSVPYTPNLWVPSSQSAYEDAVLPSLKTLCAGGGR